MTTPREQENWKKVVARFQQPSTPRALWQLVNTVIPYAGIWYLMYLTHEISWWITAPLAVLAAGFLVRIFIIFHDCGHGSYFKSRRANDITGFITGLLTFTPYYQWRWEHAVHHGSTGNLDKRGIGDVWTMTVQEYLEASRWRRFSYQLARNPVVLFAIAPVLVFLVLQRVPKNGADVRERNSVWWMNLALLGMVIGLSMLFGWKAYLVIQLIIMMVSGAAGIWLFYVQHQFEDAYWERGADWDYVAAALKGSSYYKLPKILQWFSGNIGFHHIHHLSTRIPNYNLQRCHEAEPLFQSIKPLRLMDSFRTATLRLWDEQAQRLVTFAAIRRLRPVPVRAPSREPQDRR
jgi:acyl-lipid omega-6 desaturase (Delta-12 desaturase)